MPDGYRMPSLSDSAGDETEKISETAYFDKPHNSEIKITEDEKQLIDGNQPKAKKKSHIKRNIALCMLSLLVAASVCSYLILPIVKSAVNNTVLDSKTYFKWAMRNTLYNALDENSCLLNDFDGLKLDADIKSNGKTADIESYFSDKALYFSVKSSEEDNSFSAYCNRTNLSRYISPSPEENNWFCFDKKLFTENYGIFALADINSYYKKSSFAKTAKRYTEYFLDKVSFVSREKASAIFINGNVYDATKITFTVKSKDYLDFVSKMMFDIGKDDETLSLLSDSFGITQQQIIDLANDYNMTRQGISGAYNIDYETTWYINSKGIITGAEISALQAGVSISKLVYKYGVDKTKTDFEAYLETNGIRNPSVVNSAVINDGKYSGKLTGLFNDELHTIEYSNILFNANNFVKGIYGVSGAAIFDGKKVELLFDGEKQIIKGIEEDDFELLMSASISSGFTLPDVSKAACVYDLDDIKKYN